MICIVSRTSGNGSGAEMVLNYLLYSFEHINELIIITAKDSSVSIMAKKKKIRVIEIEFVPNRYLINVYRLIKIISKLKDIKLVHAWQSKSFEISFFISKILRVPLTCTIHDHPKANIYSNQKRWRIKYVSNHSLKSVCVSNALLSECLLAGYNPNLVVIKNGLPFFKKNQSIIHSSNKIIRIGFVGMYANWKGFDIICEWIRDIRMYNIEWYLFGDITIENSNMLSELYNNNISNVFYRGFQSNEFIFNLIDILVAPSTGFDPFPTILLEAARAGVPSIASDYGGAVEIILHNFTGFLFDIQNPGLGLSYLKHLLNDIDLINMMSLNSKQNFEKNFEINRMYIQYCQLWGIQN